MSILIISSSLNPDSKSRKLAKVAAELATSGGIEADVVDLRDHPMPICDGNKSFSDSQVKELADRILEARAVILSGPVYTYGMASSTKNLVELTGRAWTGKPVGLMAAAGGKSSYMAVLGLANSLMLDYRCPIIPKYVYADGTAFEADDVVFEIRKRIEELVKTVDHWGRVL